MLGAIVPLDVPYWTGATPLARLRIRTLRMVIRQDQDRSGEFTGLRRPGAARLRLVQGGLS
jgi:hypothetical protein